MRRGARLQGCAELKVKATGCLQCDMKGPAHSAALPGIYLKNERKGICSLPYYGSSSSSNQGSLSYCDEKEATLMRFCSCVNESLIEN